VRIDYCTFYKNAKDGRIYIPLTHNNDVNKVVCLKVLIDVKNNLQNYIHLFDDYFVTYKKTRVIDISQLTGPVLDVKGQELSIPLGKRNTVYYAIWEHKINILKNSYKRHYRGESLKFIDWTHFKYMLDSSKKVNSSLLDKNNEIVVKNKCIYWIEFGHNIGCELRKERPAIIWKKFKHDNRYFVIPLTSKVKNKNSYIEISSLNKFASLEHMKLVSVKRIRRPFFDESKSIKKLNKTEIAALKQGLTNFLNLM